MACMTHNVREAFYGLDNACAKSGSTYQSSNRLDLDRHQSGPSLSILSFKYFLFVNFCCWQFLTACQQSSSHIWNSLFVNYPIQRGFFFLQNCLNFIYPALKHAGSVNICDSSQEIAFGFLRYFLERNSQEKFRSCLKTGKESADLVMFGNRQGIYRFEDSLSFEKGIFLSRVFIYEDFLLVFEDSTNLRKH